MEPVNRAFSLIELMIVVAIIGILVAVALPQFSRMSEDAKTAKTKQDMAVIVQALTKFNSLESGKAKNLNDLKGKYMVKLPVDPWGSDYYLDINTGVIGSSGMDGKINSLDDIVVTYLPDPLLIDVRFLDVGSVRVCLPDDAGNLNFGTAWRVSVNSAPNERRAGPGDVIEFTFTRPVEYGACFSPGPFLDHPVTGEKVPVEFDLTCYDNNRQEFLFTNSPLTENDPTLADHNLSSIARFTVTNAQYKHLMYISPGEPEKVIVVLGDVQAYGDTDGNGVGESFSTITPGVMYVNLKTVNKFFDRTAEKRIFQPASRPMLLRL